MANWDITHGEYNISKKTNHRELVTSVVHWFLGRYALNRKSADQHRILRVNLKTYKTMKCWGECSEGENGVDYVIDIATDQCLRDFIATLMHEMVHILQWERGSWKGEGEREATQLQYDLADDFWRCGNV
tara:strand:+ start:3978 stop:4367 length:390 start_codon:yes stop_codon:yes gene_type:complete